MLMGIQESKLERLDAALEPYFVLVDRTQTSYSLELDADQAHDLTTMGPSGHHEPSGSWPGGAVTVSVDCSVFALSSPIASA